VILYVEVVRPWHIHWGATSDEVARRLPGDTLVKDPLEVTTRAITINAWPSHVWPWLAQMGKGRGGLYSYDWLDRAFGVLDAPSCSVVLGSDAGRAPSHSGLRELAPRRAAFAAARYLGTWEGADRTSELGAHSTANYAVSSGWTSSNWGGPITRFETDRISWWVFFIPKSVRIDSPPRLIDDQWQMTVDGVVLHRLPSQ
jgi:hypothetical protein